MNLTRVQTSAELHATGSSGTISGLAAIGAGNLLVVMIDCVDETTVTFTVDDDRGNSWQMAIQQEGPTTNNSSYIGYVAGAIGGSTTITVHATPAVDFYAVVEEWNDSLGNAWELNAFSSIVEGLLTLHNCSANATVIDTNAAAVVFANSVSDSPSDTGFGTLTPGSGYTRIASSSPKVMWQFRALSLPANNERGSFTSAVIRRAAGCIAAFRVRPSPTGCWWPCCFTNAYFTHRQYLNNSSMPQVWQADRGGYSANFITEIAGKVYTAGDLYAEHGVERWSIDGDLEQNFSDDGFRSQVFRTSGGTIIANGYSPSPPYNTVWKYNTDGSINTALTDQIYATFGLDSSDNIYGSSFAGYFWKKYNSAGVLQFQKQITTGIGQLSYPYGVTAFNVDFSGNVFAIWNLQGLSWTYHVRKWDSSGTELWDKSFTQAVYADLGALFPDNAGGVFVAASGTSLHLDSSGNILKTYGAVGCFGQDGTGNYYTLYYSGTAPSTVLANIAKYNASDVQQWTQIVQWGNVFGAVPRWIAATPTHLYLSGSRTIDL